MIFVARQLQEKCREQHQDLYLAFVDLTKADTVNRDLLWNILRKFGCPPTFIVMLQQFHTGMCAPVVMAGSQSSSFPVEVGVKQGCVLAPIIFNLLLVAMTLVSHRDLQSSDCVGIEYRLDGGLFNLRRIQAKTKTSSAMMSALQYADDVAFPSLTADGLQRSHDVMSEAYLRAGLKINATITEILSTSSHDAPTFSICVNQLKNYENFTYLGSNLSFSGDLTNEIQRRINLASLAVCVSVCLVTKISRFTQRLLSIMQSSSPPSYVAARHGSHAVVISGYWSLFTSDVSSKFLNFVGSTR